MQAYPGGQREPVAFVEPAGQEYPGGEVQGPLQVGVNGVVDGAAKLPGGQGAVQFGVLNPASTP